MRNRLLIPNVPAPTLEIDPTCRAVYIRFTRAKVHKTVSDDRPGVVVSYDLDANEKVIGVEVIGVKEFSIRAIRRLLPEEMQEIDFDRAKFVPAASCRSDPVPA